MKKELLATFMVLIGFNLKAQWNESQVPNQITTLSKVGIGESEPLTDLHVRGRMMLSHGVIQRGGTPITNTGDLGLYSHLPGRWIRIVSNNSPIRFFTDIDNEGIGSDAKMSIESNGNVGIGTTTPQSLLSVGNNHGIKLSIGNSSWANTSIISTNWTEGIGDFTDVLVPGSTGNSAFIRLKSNGNVGIGESDPLAKLHIHGRIMLSHGVIQRGGTPITNTGDLGLYSHLPGRWIRIVSNNSPIRFFTDIDNEGIGSDAKMSIESNGNVGIGITNPKNKLSVDGTIWAKKVKVTLADAADWVFEDDYELKSLEKVEDFINQNKHLPDIPSADEFRENDMNVAEMNNKLLQKIEELTLYLIEQNKKVEEQSKKIENQQKEIEILKGKIQ
jgi:hypothetical protein